MDWIPALELFVKILSGLVLPALFFLWKGLNAKIDKNESAASQRSTEIKKEIKSDMEKLETASAAAFKDMQGKHDSALDKFYAKRESELHIFYEKRESDLTRLYKEFIQKDQYNASIAKNEGALNGIFDQLRDFNAALNRLIGQEKRNGE